MLIGMNNAPISPVDYIYDVTTADFENTVLKASMDRPILVDFWAPWCAPCKQLVPMLEKTVAAQNGKVALAKVNIDQNPELAQAFRVQSVPMVVAMYMGQPVSGFAGVRPQAELDQLMTQLIELHSQNTPDTLDIPAALADAALCLEQGDLASAQEIYAHIMMNDEQHIDAYCGMVRVMIAAGDLEQAAGLISSAPEAMTHDSKFAAVVTALDLAQNAQNAGELAEIEEKLAQNPDDFNIRFEFAEACFAKGFKDKAVDLLIGIITKNREWEDGKARAQLLKYFEAWGFADPASVAGRRKLSCVLFS